MLSLSSKTSEKKKGKNQARVAISEEAAERLALMMTNALNQQSSDEVTHTSQSLGSPSTLHACWTAKASHSRFNENLALCRVMVRRMKKKRKRS